ncbi:ABC transporter permease [Sporomusa sp. KB1]|jgi:sulfonate transport system permease protein|uniref:ABC transporter permease n=1 Tax=Sporomusa sp. KB1 TaxID=943346 RepID=UPI0011A0463A|nr:ABC transporter permease [Sporomusa sp. KB1]TWH48721.1 sulfonate transport system permease protein [Sporomusa sp. KB1]
MKVGAMLKNILMFFSVPLAVIFIWAFFTMNGKINPILLPTPWDVFYQIYAMAIGGDLWLHVGTSLRRVLMGYALGACAGITLGLLIGIFPILDELLGSVFLLLRPIPTLAWIPLSLLWFGIDEKSKLFIIFLGAFYPILIHVWSGVRQIDLKYVELADVLTLPRFTFVRRIVIPHSLPYIMSGLKIGLGVAWTCIISAELTTAVVGIGFFMTQARSMAHTDMVLAAMIIIGIIGNGIYVILGLIENRLMPWRKGIAND